MKSVVIVGAGKIGAVVADFLGATGDYTVTVVDHDERALSRLAAQLPAVRVQALDATTVWRWPPYSTASTRSSTPAPST